MANVSGEHLVGVLEVGALRLDVKVPAFQNLICGGKLRMRCRDSTRLCDSDEGEGGPGPRGHWGRG